MAVDLDQIKFIGPGGNLSQALGLPGSYTSSLAGPGVQDTHNKAIDIINQKLNNYHTARTQNLLSNYFKPFNPFQAPGAAPDPNSNEFGQSLARVSKNPSLDALTNNYLGELNQFAPDRKLIRGAAQGQLAGAASLGTQVRNITGVGLTDLTSTKDANRQVLDNFLERFGTAMPKLDAQTEAQTGQLNKIFADSNDPESLAARQAGIRARARAAETDALLPQIQSAILSSQIRSGTSGVNRVNDINLRNTALQLSRDSALRNAEREARDLASLTEMQRSTAGLPQNVTTANLLASKLPADVRLEIAAKESGLTGEALRQALSGEAQTTANLGSALSLEQAADPLTDLSRKLGLSGQLLNQFLQNNFLSVATKGEQLPYLAPGPSRYNYPDYVAPDQYGGDLDNFIPQYASGAQVTSAAPQTPWWQQIRNNRQGTLDSYYRTPAYQDQLLAQRDADREKNRQYQSYLDEQDYYENPY